MAPIYVLRNNIFDLVIRLHELRLNVFYATWLFETLGFSENSKLRKRLLGERKQVRRQHQAQT